MAQTISIQNNMTTTVNFSTIANGDLFYYIDQLCVKIDNNNPNYVVIDTGVCAKLEDTDQVFLPNSVSIIVE